MLNRKDDQREAKRMVLFCVAAASMVLLLFLVALYMHDSKKVKKTEIKQEENKAAEVDDLGIGEKNIVSSDLDFWDMYENKKPSIIDDSKEEESDAKKYNPGNKNTDKDSLDYSDIKGDSTSSKNISDAPSKYDDEDNSESMNVTRNTKNEEADDGNHIKVVGSDGKDAWYEILEDVNKNPYKFANNLTYDNGMLKYTSSDIRSVEGIDISNYQGTIDFAKVKNAGIDYVMIKVASRGYESGTINIDDKFVEYANGATAAGLPIGAFITSNAITDVEAIEEANYAIAASNNYNVKYPIAIEFSSVSNGNSRTDRLTSSERTAIVKTFCDTVKAYGRVPAICANRDFLISNLNLSDLKDYEIWLKDEAVLADYMMVEHIGNDRDTEETMDNSSSSSSNKTSSSSSKSSSSSSKLNKSSSNLTKSQLSNKSSSKSSANRDEDLDFVGTDFPYAFSMWQYSDNGSINGIEGKVNLNISFVNFAER